MQALLFDPNKLAPTYPASMILRPPKFNAYYDVMDVKPVNGATWRLELSRPGRRQAAVDAAQLQALPQSSMVIKHICVEGWSYIGGWSGVPLRGFLERIGADLRAKYVAFKTADDYPSSIDMATALHPQTLLATPVRRRHVGRSVRISGTPAHGDQAWIQKSKVDHSHRGDEHLSWRILGNERLSMVCGHMKRTTADPHPACVVPPDRDRERGPCAEHDAGGHAASARYESGAIRCHAISATCSGRRSSRQRGSSSRREPRRSRSGSSNWFATAMARSWS